VQRKEVVSMTKDRHFPMKKRAVSREVMFNFRCNCHGVDFQVSTWSTRSNATQRPRMVNATEVH
jgi:hypothetical protein